MKYCKECWVELDQSMESCPLCNIPASECEDCLPEVGYNLIPKRKNIDSISPSNAEFSKKQKHEIFRKLAALILISSFVATLLVDIVSSGNITWSRYTMISCVILFLAIYLLYLFHYKIIMSITIVFMLLSLLFWVFGTSFFKVSWSIIPALPLLALLYIAIVFMMLLAIYIKEQGINLIGCFFIITGLLNIGIETCIDIFTLNKINLRWSLFVAVSTFCVGFLLLFVHYRLKKGRELKRLFHF